MALELKMFATMSRRQIAAFFFIWHFSVGFNMAGISLIFSVVVLLFVSLCKVLHGSSSTMKTAFLFEDGSSRRRNVMLVIAHPDDESMFFAPVIRHLISMGHNMHILCISTGNADGMGSTRKEELYMASTVLKFLLQAHQMIADCWVSKNDIKSVSLNADSNTSSEHSGPSRFAGWFWQSMGLEYIV